MRGTASTSSISSYLSSHYYSLSTTTATAAKTTTTPIKAIVIYLLSLILALFLVDPINAEALNGDNHISRSKIFEEKGKYL